MTVLSWRAVIGPGRFSQCSPIRHNVGAAMQGGIFRFRSWSQRRHDYGKFLVVNKRDS